MQVELSVEELTAMQILLDQRISVCGSRIHEMLKEKLDEVIEQAQELEALDLNDCGDACKL